MNKLEKTIYEMLTENTGIHILDSGMGHDRHWQKNQEKTLKDFQNESPISWGIEDYRSQENKNQPLTSSDIVYTISLFHYLQSVLSIDDVCEKFNKLECKEWDSGFYGISKKQEKYLLEKLELKPVGEAFNTYDGDSTLSQVLQGQYFSNDGTDIPDYVLLQIHNGCDIRGGYTNAKLFKLEADYLEASPLAYGTIDDVQVENTYDGINITSENGGEIEINDKSIITLELAN